MKELEPNKIDASKLPAVFVAKWGGELLDEGFVPFPKRLLRILKDLFSHPDGIEDLAVIMSIADYLRPNLTRGPSMEYLALVAGLSVDEFQQRLSKLLKKGWVKFEGPDEALKIDIDGFVKKALKYSK